MGGGAAVAPAVRVTTCRIYYLCIARTLLGQWVPHFLEPFLSMPLPWHLHGCPSVAYRRNPSEAALYLHPLSALYQNGCRSRPGGFVRYSPSSRCRPTEALRTRRQLAHCSQRSTGSRGGLETLGAARPRERSSWRGRSPELRNWSVRPSGGSVLQQVAASSSRPGRTGRRKSRSPRSI